MMLSVMSAAGSDVYIKAVILLSTIHKMMNFILTVVFRARVCSRHYHHSMRMRACSKPVLP
jgi:hypothetical protein